MNDQDYIRAGVELADGFDITDGGKGFGLTIRKLDGEDWTWCFGDVKDPPTFLKDALAAQLVRQVDALGFLDCDIDGGGTSIICPSNSEVAPIRVWGDNRAMNTIKVVVDSKVLKE